MSLNPLFHSEVRTHPLFNELSDESFHTISQHSGFVSLKKNEVLFECGYDANHFFLVRTGQVTFYQTSLEGNEKIVELFDSGQSFAENFIFSDHNSYSINARATCDTDLFYFEVDKFKAQLYHSREACFALMRQMSNCVKDQTQEIVQLSIHDAQYRLVNYLLRNSCDANDQHCEAMVKLSSTKSLLASRLSITPETFSRILARLKKQCLITIKDDLIMLKKPAELRQLIGYCSGNLKESPDMKQKLRFIA